MTQGRYLTELRRSNAAGLHDHKPSRSEQKRQAIKMSQFDGDFLPEFREPSEEDLDQIDAEDFIDARREVPFSEEDYELSFNGSDAFTSYSPDEDRYDDEDDEE